MRMKRFAAFMMMVLLFTACSRKAAEKKELPATVEITLPDSAPRKKEQKEKQVYTPPFLQDIKMKNYFKTTDSIIEFYCKTACYNLDEHILIRANPRIIDTLAGFDYYLKMKAGVFVYDQKELVVFHKGDSLRIPGEQETKKIEKKLKSTVIDVNIPEYKPRIMEEGKVIYSFPVRVGANKEKYLETAGRIVNLKTHTGNGEIVRLERNPWYVNPATGKRYYGTRRDDGRYTMMPLIPWIEPSINGIRYGDLIHPTTNPETLGKPYSHGCIGLNESDAWRVYYSAPLGTKVVFRYELEITGENNDTLVLQDIYGEGKNR